MRSVNYSKVRYSNWETCLPRGELAGELKGMCEGVTVRKLPYEVKGTGVC